MKRTTWLAALAVFAAGCIGSADTADTTTPSSTHNVATTTTTSSPTLPPTTLPPTTMPATTPPSASTSPPRTTGDAVALAQARLDALWSADPTNPYGALEIRCPDPDRLIEIGSVFMCRGLDRNAATTDIHSLAFLVLDDEGTTSMLTRGDLADLETAYSESPHGLLCRDLVAGETPKPFDRIFTTYDTPDFDTTAFLATAYWFLEGRPDRMDADRNGIPCETVLPPEAIAWVWDGGLLTGGYQESELSIPLLHRFDDFPAVPVGSRLADFTFNLSGGTGVLIETPNGWQVWSGPGGDASWQVEVLPEEVFGETLLRTVAVFANETYVAGHHAAGYTPAVWKRARDGEWLELELERTGGWGTVWRIVECDGNLVFAGHDSASNQVGEYKLWSPNESGELVVVAGTDSGPPGTGVPAPALFCSEGHFMALVTQLVDPGDPPSPEFSCTNQVWSSPAGREWRIAADNVIQPAICHPRGLAPAGSTIVVVASADRQIATSSDGVNWSRLDLEAAGFEPDDWIDTMGGGGLGLLIVGGGPHRSGHVVDSGWP